MNEVIWHDLECGGYRQDLALWRSLADAYQGPVLDVGAGTGRVTLDLARAGHSVLALDADETLLSELRRRAEGLPVRTICADARDFNLTDPVGICLVPMQTVQLLGGSEGRLAFLECARRHVRSGGLIAMAITAELEGFEVRDGEPAPLPDLVELAGVVYCSQPTSVRREDHQFVLERRRETVDPRGGRQVSQDRVALDCLTVDELEQEAESLGLRTLPAHEIPPTHEHVGSQVVMLTA
ncbi:MAG TPA: class I SAM-dependent methyltransferase [Solirubrobacteraceae bacterium]|jgi:SAM-dependent methyltransferase|nr:class I SAM-dependent methyltransferase [Solirubrobacteraceae bacterium]